MPRKTGTALCKRLSAGATKAARLKVHRLKMARKAINRRHYYEEATNGKGAKGRLYKLMRAGGRGPWTKFFVEHPELNERPKKGRRR